MKLIEKRGKNIGKLFLDKAEDKNLFIWIPEGADITKEKMPVVYSFDAQMLFEQYETPFKTLGEKRYWNIDAVAQRLIDEEKINNTIIAGIFNAGEERAQEYIPYVFEKGKEFAEFMVGKVIPYVEKHYNARNDKKGRAIMGSSLGGLMAMYMANNYTEYFDTACALSIHDPWLECDIENYSMHDIKVWIDVGTLEYQESSKYSIVAEELFKDKDGVKLGEIYGYTMAARNIIDRMIDKGYRYGKELFYYEDKNGKHSEEFWERRVKYALMLFKGKIEGSLEKIDVDIEAVKDKFNNVCYIINPIGTFSSGMKYSLYREAEYTISGSGSITEKGLINLIDDKEAEITVKYGSIKKSMKIERKMLEEMKIEIPV